MKTNKRLERNEIACPTARERCQAGGLRHLRRPAMMKIASSSQSRPGLLAMTAGRIAMTIVSLLLLVYAAMLNPEPAFAGASVTVSGSAWAIGAKKASTAATPPSSFTVTNAASGGTEDITISVANSVSAGWQPAATAGSNQFVLRLTDAAGQVITATPYTLFTGLANNATSSSFTLYFMTPSSVTAGEGVEQTITVTLTATNWVFVWGCGSNLVVAHTIGTVAPVTKTVTYGTTSSTLTGSAKCWITQNLGADIQATAVGDSRETAAGWYWQFNRKQGFKHNGTTRTPTTAWNTTNDNLSATWETAKDPCALLLGTGWRLPISAEWTSADANGAWTTRAGPWGSVLKIHAAGDLEYSSGGLEYRGSDGSSWSSEQSAAANGWTLSFSSSTSGVVGYAKAVARSVRCLKD